MAESPVFKWPLPIRSDRASIHTIISNLGTAIEATVNALTGRVGAMETHWSRQGTAGKRILTGSTVATVSGSGGVTVQMGAGNFTSPPAVMAMIGDESGNFQSLQLVHSSITATAFSARILKPDGTPWLGGGGVRVNWIAIGQAP